MGRLRWQWLMILSDSEVTSSRERHPAYTVGVIRWERLPVSTLVPETLCGPDLDVSVRKQPPGTYATRQHRTPTPDNVTGCANTPEGGRHG